ncbi:hypothetical protein Hanom_Chr17g01528361 [Helianthus anomalus]
MPFSSLGGLASFATFVQMFVFPHLDPKGLKSWSSIRLVNSIHQGNSVFFTLCTSISHNVPSIQNTELPFKLTKRREYPDLTEKNG